MTFVFVLLVTFAVWEARTNTRHPDPPTDGDQWRTLAAAFVALVIAAGFLMVVDWSPPKLSDPPPPPRLVQFG